MGSDLNILICHDSFDAIGGAEKVVAAIEKAFDTPIVAANVDPDIIRELGIDAVLSTTWAELKTEPP